jgi:hypothetical protein
MEPKKTDGSLLIVIPSLCVYRMRLKNAESSAVDMVT